MKLTILSLCLLYTVGNIVEAAPYGNSTEAAASLGISKLQERYNEYIEATLRTRYSGCTADNVVYRQEWGSLSAQSRIEYTNAVQCLQKKSALSSKVDVPGARSRFDDFSATHIMSTLSVHYSGLFLPYHRYFVWLYEKALQEECGYTGTQPYWDWTLSWEDPRKSTVFDGSSTSMGSNGRSISKGPTNIQAFGLELDLAPGTGGGCVHSGPFQNYTLNLGPVASAVDRNTTGLEYNPRCLSRDISLEWSKQMKPTDVLGLLEDYDDISSFDTQLEALDGLHAGGHFAVGGIFVDAFASAGDPIFFLHHAQIDRLWSIWQSEHPKNRTNQVFGTVTSFNGELPTSHVSLFYSSGASFMLTWSNLLLDPPSQNVTLNSDVDMGILAPVEPVSNIVSAVNGPFCYVYV